MKKIICYGDSNTFGYNPKDGTKYDNNICWTQALEKNLGKEYTVINEGVCDRTGFVNNPKGDLYSAPLHFPKFIAVTQNFYLLILWIGTNDLQFQYDLNIDTIENGLENLIKLAKTKAENIIVIPPVILSEKVLEGNFSYQFDKTSIDKSGSIESLYKQIAKTNNCAYFNINELTKPSDFDGLHYDENSHKLIAAKLADYIRNSIS